MSEMPWFPFYVDKFLGSRKVRRMTAKQVGTYVLLLADEWSDGPLPDADELLSFIGKAPADEVRAVLELAFEKRDGRWINPPLERIRAEQEEKRKKRSRAGRAGARARWQSDGKGNADANGDRIASASGRHSKRNAEAMAIEKKKENKKKKRGEERENTPDNQSTLKDWLGEDYSGCLNGLDNYTQAAIYGSYGPEGTQVSIWGNVPDERRPAVLSMAILDYAAARGDKPWHGRFFRRILSDTIRDEAKPPPTSEAHGWTADRERQHYDSHQRGGTRSSDAPASRPIIASCDDCGGPLVFGDCPKCLTGSEAA